jgi:hypothetical protein
VRRQILLVWALCISQGLVFIVCTPLWEGWDEAFHYSYVQLLAEKRELPVFHRAIVSKEIVSSFENAPLSYAANLNVGSKFTTFEEYWKLPSPERHRREQQLRAIPNAERTALPDPPYQFHSYEAHHGPLYYLVAAPIYYLFSSSDLLTRAFILRLFSLLLGSITIPLAFLTTRHVSSERRHLRRIPLLLVLLPLFYPVVGRISNDSLAVPLFSALILMVLRYFDRGCEIRNAVWIGVILGLGLLTKAYFLTAVPALITIFVGFCFAGRPRKRLLAHLCLIGVLSCLVAGWWYARNYSLYGNVSGMQELTLTSNLTFMDRIEAATRVEWSSSIQSMLKQHIWIGNTTFLGLSRSTYQVGYFLIFLSILGAGMSLIRRQSSKLSILTVFYSFFMIGLLYHMLVNYILIGGPDGTGGWYLYAVIIAESVLVVHGLETLAGQRWAATSNAVLVLYVLVVNLLSLFCKALPYYGGFFIPRFHLSHLVELYSPSGFKVMLENLAVNKPSFVTPLFIGMVIGTFVALLAWTLFREWHSGGRRPRLPAHQDS